MAAELPWERLPVHLSYGVTRDGRIFFIDDRLQTTSWLHPLKGKAVQTGHRTVPGLPAGWEQAVSPEGAIYFIDHNRGTTTFDHPVSGQPVHYEPPSPPKSPPQSPTDRQTKSPNKLRPLKAPPAKRDNNAMVSIKGWLYKMETGGWKSWKKRWCVLSNFGLFFYKDDKEERPLGSILLPSYRIELCLSSETSKKYAFKCEHNNMKTYMFASDSQDDRDRWVEALKYAAMLKNPPSKSETEKNNNNTKLIPKSPFMTWDDEEDDEDYSPQNKEFWQGDLISAKQPSPGSQTTSPQQYPPYQNGQGSHPHSNNQSGYSPYQGQGNDPRYSGNDPRFQGPQSRDPSGNVRNSYSIDPRDPRYNRDVSPQRQNSGSLDRSRSQQPDYDHWESHPSGYDPRHGMGGPNHNNPYASRNGSQDPRGQFPPEIDSSRHSLSLRSDQYNPSYRDPRSDHSPSGRGYDPQRPNYSEEAYDRTDGRPHFPNQQNSPGNQPGNNPDPHYNPHNMENYDRQPGHHGQQYPSQEDPHQRYRDITHQSRHPIRVQIGPLGGLYAQVNREGTKKVQGPNRTEESHYMSMGPKKIQPSHKNSKQNSLEREHASKQHMPKDQSRHYSQDYPSMSDMQDPYRGQNPNTEFEGYYSPKTESMNREMAQRPLPEIRHNNALQGRHIEHGQQRSDPDDGYSTLTKYQDRHKRDHQLQQQSPPQQQYPEQDMGRYPSQDQFHSQQHYPEQNRERYLPQDQFQPQQQDRGRYPPQDQSHADQQDRGRYQPQDQYQAGQQDRGRYPPQDQYQAGLQDRGRYPPQDQYQAGQQDRGRYPPQDQYQAGQHYPGQDESQIQRQQQQPSYTDPRSDRYDGPHTYVNLPERRPQIKVEKIDLDEDIPGRPPLPTAVRQQIVEELAQTKTPKTAEKLFEAERNLELRMQQPSYFDYPLPKLPQQESKHYGSQRNSLARHQAEEERQAGIRSQADPRDYHREQYSPGDPRHATIPKQVYAEQDSYDSREDPYRSRVGDSHDTYGRNPDVQDSYRNRSNEEQDPYRRQGEPQNPYKRNQDMQDPYGRREDPYSSRREGDPRSMQSHPRQPQDDRSRQVMSANNMLETRPETSVSANKMDSHMLGGIVGDAKPSFANTLQNVQSEVDYVVKVKHSNLPSPETYSNSSSYGTPQDQRSRTDKDRSAKDNRSHRKGHRPRQSGRAKQRQEQQREKEKAKEESLLKKQLANLNFESDPMSSSYQYVNLNPLAMPMDQVQKLVESSDENEVDLQTKMRERRSAFRPLLKNPKGNNFVKHLEKQKASPPSALEPNRVISHNEDVLGQSSGHQLDFYRQDFIDNDDEDEETELKKRLSTASSLDSRLTGDTQEVRPGGEQRRGRKLGESKLGPIQTVKEDPDMPDDDIIETRALPNLNKKFPLSGPRLRMSISAGDLIGKTHDELVLLLIQLRRDHSSLEKTRTFYRKGIDKKRPAEQHYRRLLQESDGPFDYEIEKEHREYMSLKKECEETEKKLEVYRPLVNLVHNMVNMGSLYGGDNFMLASQYRKHLLSPDEITPAKKMLEFSRQHQEDRIIKDMNDEIKQLTAEEVDLEEKLERLYELDRLMQEQSHMVTSEQEDKEVFEKALQGILRQQDMNRDNPRELDKLIQQQRTIEREISKKMHHLARVSKELEETTAENNKIEHEVALLRTKVHGELNRSKSAPSLSDENMRTKMKMEKDLAKVQNMMTGLNQQGKQLSAAMNTLRRSSAGASFNSAFKPVDSNKPPKSASTYMETDLDTRKSSDLSQVQEVLMSYQDVSPSQSSPTVTVRTLGSSNQPPLQEAPIVRSHMTTQESGLMPDQDDPDTDQWNIGDADDNTKRFFGIIPREKPKVLTVRDVKRQSEQRKERDKIRKEPEDNDDSWNGFDSEELESQGYNPYTTDNAPGTMNGHPIYENLPPSDSKLRKAKSWSSVVPNFAHSEPSSRRSSLLYLVTPRPFVPFGSQPSSVGSDIESQSKIYAPSSTSGSYRLGMSDDDKVVKATRVIIQPELRGTSDNAHSPTSPPLRTGMYNVKRTPKGRYMTVSSSEPAKRETSVIERVQSLHSSAGDLITNRAMDPVPDIVQSSRMRDEQVDLDMIDKEILFVPEKVLIPERYNPDSDDDDVTEEEQLRRQEKAEKIKRLLTQQSLHSLSQPDVSKIPGDLHQQVEKEKVKRAQLLDIGQELARQVKIKTRQAAAERRKTWSGSPSKVSTDSTFTNGFGNEGYDVALYNGHTDYSKERLFI